MEFTHNQSYRVNRQTDIYFRTASPNAFVSLTNVMKHEKKHFGRFLVWYTYCTKKQNEHLSTRNENKRNHSLINVSIISIYFTQNHSNIFQKYISICSSKLLIGSRFKTFLSADFLTPNAFCHFSFS